MYILRYVYFVKILLQKTTLIIDFNKQNQSEVFQEKKVLFHKHSFSPAMQGWGISPNNKRTSKQEKENVFKNDLFYQRKHDHQLFLHIFSQIFEK